MIKDQRLRLGELVQIRDGSKFKDVWLDGFELRKLRLDLSALLELKDSVELAKKRLKKRTQKLATAEEKALINNS